VLADQLPGQLVGLAGRRAVADRDQLDRVPRDQRAHLLREALLLVGMSWIIGAAYGAMPFYFWAHFALAMEGDQFHPFRSYINCYFEAMSGFTTTGATVLSDIEIIPRSLLLWRSMTQWLGGLGIIVLMVAVLAGLTHGGLQLMSAD
jgi:trk system potassium uptake protein